MAMFDKVGKRERVMLIVLGGVVLLAIVFLLLQSGGDTTAPPTGGRTFRPGGGGFTPSATPTQQPSPEQTQIDNFQGKDPFLPLILPSGQSGGPAPSSTASPGSSGGTQTGSRVVLVDIYKQNGVRFASVQVGSDVHNVKEGDTFAGTYRVVTITDQCATFVNGDERFTLCIGQEVFK